MQKNCYNNGNTIQYMYIYIYIVASLECRFGVINDVAILGGCFCMISSHPLLQHLPEN